MAEDDDPAGIAEQRLNAARGLDVNRNYYTVQAHALISIAASLREIVALLKAEALPMRFAVRATNSLHDRDNPDIDDGV